MHLRQIKRMQVAVITALLSIACPAFAADVSAGMVKNLSGSVSIVRAGVSTPAQVGSEVMAQDRIVTGANSSVGMALKDDTLLSAGSGSVLVLDRFAFNTTTYEGSMSLRILKGTLRAITGLISHHSPGAMKFSTPTATLGIRGTDFIVDVP
jgi:hypothetical protein